MAIIAALEERFEVEIPLEDLFDLTNVQSIIEEIKNLKK
jgi:acyl carrier protein